MLAAVRRNCRLCWARTEAVFVDAVFEGPCSGMTHRIDGKFTGLDDCQGLLLWRAILQWLGGIGILLLRWFSWPELRVLAGMQIFKSEAF